MVTNINWFIPVLYKYKSICNNDEHVSSFNICNYKEYLEINSISCMGLKSLATKPFKKYTLISTKKLPMTINQSILVLFVTYRLRPIFEGIADFKL